MVAKLHSEVTEFYEADGYSDQVTGFTESEEELADVVLMAMSIAEELQINLSDVIIAKHYYNLGRPHKHGKDNG